MTVQKRLIDDIDLSQISAKRWKSEVGLARMAIAESKLTDASRLLHKALELSSELNERDYARGVCELGLGIVCLHQNNDKDAHKHFDRAVNIARSNSDEKHDALLGVVLRHYANAMLDEHNLQQAEEYLEESIKVLQKHGVTTAYYLALSVCDYAAIQIIKGEVEQAQKMLPSAIEILGTLSDPEDADYVRASFIFEVATSKPEENEFLELWQASATKLQYQLGSKHPYLIRVLNRFAGAAKKAGRDDLIKQTGSFFASSFKS